MPGCSYKTAINSADLSTGYLTLLRPPLELKSRFGDKFLGSCMGRVFGALELVKREKLKTKYVEDHREVAQE